MLEIENEKSSRLTYSSNINTFSTRNITPRLRKMFEHIDTLFSAHDEKVLVKQWIRDFQDGFALKDEPLGSNDSVPMEIDTGDHLPICRRPYKFQFPTSPKLR